MYMQTIIPTIYTIYYNSYHALRIQAKNIRQDNVQKGNLDQNIDWFVIKEITIKKVIESENKTDSKKQVYTEHKSIPRPVHV